MTKYTDNQLQELIRQAGEGFKLSAAHRSAIKFHIVDVINSSAPQIHPRHIIKPLGFTMPILVPIALVILLALGGGTASLANAAKPGDALYPMDQWMEQVQQQLTTDPNAKAILYAQIANERTEELAELQSVNVSQLTSASVQNAWQTHQEEAAEHLSRSIEQINAIQDAFQKKLTATTDPVQKAALQKVFDQLQTVAANRENRLNDLPPRPLPNLGTDLRQQIQQIRQQHQAEMQQIHQNMMQEFDGDTVPTVNGTPAPGQSAPTSEVVPIPSGSATGQSAMIMYVPRDKNGNIDVSLTDGDNDGIPDIYQVLPNLNPRFL